MKKTPANKSTPDQESRKAAEMPAEYMFDYQKARPNRFASRMQAAPLVVILDPDVAKIFTSGEEVNQALRALISAMPKRPAAAGDGAGQGQPG